jgi:hypothetical protein
VSADIEGIAQALIDLNAGLREWAVGVDRSVTSIREAVESVRDLAVEGYEVSELEQTGAQPAVGSDDVEYEGGEIVQAEPVMPARLSGDPGELEQRIRESVELSLYLADQIEEFDRVLGGMGELGGRIEGVVQQGMRRALAARSKLDTDANAALEETLALLDSYVDKMSGTVEGFVQSEETLRKLGLGQVELASRLDSLYEAVHALAVGRDDRAATITKPARTSRAKPKAKPKPKPTKKTTAKRTTRKRSSKPARRDQPKDRAD